MPNKSTKTHTIAGLGIPTGVLCTPTEFKALQEILSVVAKTNIIRVVAHNTTDTVTPKLPTTQADVFAFVRKLANKHKLPVGFYGINKHREFIKVVEGNEEDFHEVYDWK